MGRDFELPWVATLAGRVWRNTTNNPAFSMRDYCGKLCGTSLVARGASPASLACMSREAVVAITTEASPNAIDMSIDVDGLAHRGPRGFATATPEELLRGRSPIRRCAIPFASAFAHAPPGIWVINTANRCAAVSFGSAESFAASTQGSRLSRDSAESTVKWMSCSLPATGAYKKLSNSGLKNEIEAAVLMMTTRQIEPNSSRQLRSHFFGLKRTIGWSFGHRLDRPAVAFGIFPKRGFELATVDCGQLSLKSGCSHGGQFDGGRNAPISRRGAGRIVERYVDRLDPVDPRGLGAINSGQREGMDEGHRRASGSLFHRGPFQWRRRPQASIGSTDPEFGRIAHGWVPSLTRPTLV